MAWVYHFKFNKPKLEEMLWLRRMGWSYTALAERYSCPKTTIRFLVRKNGLAGGTIVVSLTHDEYVSTTTQPPAIKETIQIQDVGERISQGKTYAEYLRDERDRKWNRLLKRA